jgi:hypothetical protein
MPIRIAVMCEKCERIYLLAHPDSAKRIRFTPRSDPQPPYRLTCVCRMERYFDLAHSFAYRVSEDACTVGYADWVILWAVDRQTTAKFVGIMVARDGVEPPTPAFSELGFPVFSTTSMVVEGPLNTGKHRRSKAIVGDDRG